MRALVVVLLIASACSRAPSRDGRLVVFAAASLRDVFTRLAADFRRAHPDAEVDFNFAGTQQLRAQLEHGAAADVFASADPRHMAELVKAGRVGTPVTFARNELVLVVSREAAQTVRSFEELPNARRVALGAPEVPVGRYTALVLDRAGGGFRARVEAHVVSRELNVRQVLARVRLGEADVGVVYRSDAAAARDVALVPIPTGLNVVAEYPIAAVTGAPHPSLARAWIDLVRSPAGRAALERAGFLPAG